jgi:hypothetical protein
MLQIINTGVRRGRNAGTPVCSRLFSSQWPREPTEDQTIDFGFQNVLRGDKASRVANVFSSVASSYDVMNDLMSGGLHRCWKEQ